MDNNSGNNIDICAGPNAANSDADFIFERTGNILGGFYSLAKIGSVLIYNTADSQGSPESDTHYYLLMSSGGTTCATAGAWSGGEFYVYWDAYC